MWYLLLSVLFLGCFAAVLGVVNNRKRQRRMALGREPIDEAAVETADGCCGEHAFCEHESMMSLASQKISYFDDEELDIYQRRASGDYSSEEIDQFREVLYTLREEEVVEWLHSLKFRELQLPDSLKDEAYMIVEEQRINNESSN